MTGEGGRKRRRGRGGGKGEGKREREMTKERERESSEIVSMQLLFEHHFFQKCVNVTLDETNNFHSEKKCHNQFANTNVPKFPNINTDRNQTTIDLYRHSGLFY